MLAFARRQELRMEVVDAAALVASLREMVVKSIGPAVPVQFDLPSGEAACWVRTDPNQLELALLNLCVNARDAVPPDRFPEARIRIALRHVPARLPDLAPEGGLPPSVRDAAGPPGPGNWVVLSVADGGTGMDAETLARATEPFFTTKEVGRGTGLGLSMVHGLCEQSGGALRLRSAPGRGTTAEMWLPRAAAPAATDDAGPAAAPAAPDRRLSVLVVDDDPLVLASTVALVTDLGHEATAADSAEAALRALRAGAVPDVIVTDHAMPGVTGLDLARRVAASRPGLPVILASGYADLEDGAAADLIRLSKPFSRDALARSLADATAARVG
ncbi:ATP-binding protein [Roseomonas sp. CCTCC AB2023176]|uniref:ATP-binding protein n=1 Tax=Roseomonas sp. CCTCC AB2023176 TaxID=3342640 RepID=UPI0035DF0AD6